MDFSALFQWLWNIIKGWFLAVLDLFKDAVVWLLDAVFGVIAAAIEALPVPGFMATGLGGLFSGVDPSVLYFVGVLGIPQGLATIGVAVGFRLIRKLVTLGQW